MTSATSLRPFTRDEFMRMVEVGVIDADERVELIEGEIVEMAAMGPGHVSPLEAMTEALVLAYHGRARVRVEASLDCGAMSLPQPDIAVIGPDAAPARERHPRAGEAILIVEISLTTHAVDRRKSRIYARAGAPVFWQVDARDGVVRVHTGPGEDGYAVEEEVRPPGMLVLPGLGRTIAAREVLGLP